MNHQVDCIVVGQGLAGSILAWELLERGYKVIVVDKHHDGSSSKVAAGILNPITGKRLAKSWKLDELLPYAKAYYSMMEAKLGKEFFCEREVHRIFESEEEIEFLEKRLQDTEYDPYIGDRHAPDTFDEFFNMERGSFIIREAATLDTPVFLEAIRNYFEKNGVLKDSLFLYSDLKVEENSIEWKGIKTRYCIFCEGHKVLDNPYFRGLPFRPVKGEILTIEISGSDKDPIIPHEQIIKRDKWIVPKGRGVYRAGATYDKSRLDGEITRHGRAEIMRGLQDILGEHASEVTGHEAGIRPSTHDFKPYIGLADENHYIGIFNGFGAKGTLMIPYLAAHFADFLEGKVELDKDVDIKRCKKKSL